MPQALVSKLQCSATGTWTSTTCHGCGGFLVSRCPLRGLYRFAGFATHVHSLQRIHSRFRTCWRFSRDSTIKQGEDVVYLLCERHHKKASSDLSDRTTHRLGCLVCSNSCKSPSIWEDSNPMVEAIKPIHRSVQGSPDRPASESDKPPIEVHPAASPPCCGLCTRMRTLQRFVKPLADNRNVDFSDKGT